MSIDKEKSYNKERKRVFTSISEPTLLLMPKKYVVDVHEHWQRKKATIKKQREFLLQALYLPCYICWCQRNMSMKMRKYKNSADVFHRHHVHEKYVFQKFADKQILSTVLLLWCGSLTFHQLIILQQSDLLRHPIHENMIQTISQWIAVKKKRRNKA